jgi:hypothetical protein
MSWRVAASSGQDGFAGGAPDGLDGVGSHLLQAVGEIGMVNRDPRTGAQVLPELLQRLGRRAHAALAHQLIELLVVGVMP